MNLKEILKIAGGSVGSFIVILIAMYFLYPHVTPEAEDNGAEGFETEDLSFESNMNGPKAVESLNEQIKNLQEAVDSVRAIEQKYKSQVDSLNGEIALLQEERANENLEESPAVTAENLKDVSRSLLNMDEDSLTPIINLLDEDELVGLYNSANNMQRAKLLQTLEPDKAAKILKKIM